MLAPIVTKDMQLFPKRPLPAHVKNVRSRAQSLKDLPRQQQQQKMAQPVKQRHAMSTGNLNNSTPARSPPKSNSIVKRQLDSIAEGVELTSNSSSANIVGGASLPPVPSSSKLTKKDANGNAQTEDDYGKLIRYPAINLATSKHSPDQELCSLQELGTSRPCSSMSTFSDPSTSNKPDKHKGLIKMFASAFKSKSRPKTSRCNQEADSHQNHPTTTNESPTVP